MNYILIYLLGSLCAYILCRLPLKRKCKLAKEYHRKSDIYIALFTALFSWLGVIIVPIVYGFAWLEVNRFKKKNYER